MTRDLIVTLADDNYFDQARQLFSSVYHNSGWKGDYLLLALEMGDEHREWFQNKGIIVKRIERFGNVELPNHSRTVLGKFHLFDRDFKEWRRVIYLDADTMVTSSLDRLLDLKGFWAVADFNDMKLKGQFRDPEKDGFGRNERMAFDKLASHFDLDEISFNSGVMAFDGDMAGDKAFEHLIELYKDYEPITLHDQTILNLFFYRKWKRLPFVYNNYHLYSRRPRSIRSEKCDGIVNHFILDRVWKTKNKDYYPIWRKNLETSDYIDLERRKGPTVVWDELRIEKTTKKLMDGSIKENTIKGRFILSLISVDRRIGKIGLAIKKISPRIYELIRKRDNDLVP